MKKIEQYNLTNERMIDAFDKLVIKKNGKPFSVDDICKETNIHHQTFYHHFNSREDFINYVVEKKLKDLYSIMNKNGNYISTFCKCFIEISKHQRQILSKYLKLEEFKAKFNNDATILLDFAISKEYNFINNEAKVFIIGGIIAYLKFSIINNNFDNFETNLFNIINKLTNN